MNPYEAPQTPFESATRSTWPWWVNCVLQDYPNRTKAVCAGKGMLLMAFIYNLLNVNILHHIDIIVAFTTIMLAMTIPYTIWHWCAIWWVDRHQGWPQS